MSEPLAPPRPLVTPTAQPFWDALTEHCVVVQHCGSCGAWVHYPRVRCPRCGADHGKPHLPGSTWQYSISHSGDFVAIAFSEGTDVGLDIEVDSAPRSRDVWQAVLSPAELEVLDGVDFGERDHAFLRFWTRKEAALKATARGLTVEPRLLEVSAPAMAAAVTRWPAELAAVPLPSLCDLDFLPGHVAALARLGPLGAVRAVEVSPRPPKGATMGEA